MAVVNQHPGNDYYVQPSIGVIQRQSDPLLAAGLKALGYQGPVTWDQAQTVLMLSKKVAQSGEAPIPVTAGQAATGQVPDPFSGLLPSFTNLRDLMLRVVKVAAGLMLVMAGLNMMAKDEAHIDVIGSLKDAAKMGAVA